MCSFSHMPDGHPFSHPQCFFWFWVRTLVFHRPPTAARCWFSARACATLQQGIHRTMARDLISTIISRPSARPWKWLASRFSWVRVWLDLVDDWNIESHTYHLPTHVLHTGKRSSFSFFAGCGVFSTVRRALSRTSASSKFRPNKHEPSILSSHRISSMRP